MQDEKVLQVFMDSLEVKYDRKTNGLIIFSHIFTLENPLGNINLKITDGCEENIHCMVSQSDV